MITQKNRFSIILSIIVILLLIPLVAMQFSEQVDWSLFDFLVMGILLLGTGLTIEVVLRLVKNTGKRLLACGAILFIFFLVWAELAVGIFGTPFAGT